MKSPLIRIFSPETQLDFLQVTREYLAGWVYSRPPDAPLLNHWSTLANFQPANIRIAYRETEPQAALHGEIHSQGGIVHLLASRPGGGEEAFALLKQFEQEVCTKGGTQLSGPHWASSPFYGGYVLGNEPLIPSWDTNGTCAFVHAGYRMEIRGVLMVCSLAEDIPQEHLPAGYEIVPVSRPLEFDARPFGYHAVQNGQKAAHCHARFYPHLSAPNGRPVGQVGNVTTEADHRGRGLARILVKRCLGDLRNMGAAEALIATSLDNFPALKSYENAGFTRRYNMNWWVKSINPPKAD
jgi:ribosomal protein S18 acetylase RimI-like enzyme